MPSPFCYHLNAIYESKRRRVLAEVPTAAGYGATADGLAECFSFVDGVGVWWGTYSDNAMNNSFK